MHTAGAEGPSDDDSDTEVPAEQEGGMIEDDSIHTFEGHTGTTLEAYVLAPVPHQLRSQIRCWLCAGTLRGQM
jgi:hypothetical protein